MRSFSVVVSYVLILVHITSSAVFAVPERIVSDSSCLAPDSYFHLNDSEDGLFPIEGISEVVVKGAKKILIHPVKKTGSRIIEFFRVPLNRFLLTALLLFIIIPNTVMSQSAELHYIAERTLLEDQMYNDLEFPFFDGYRLAIKKKELAEQPELNEGHIAGPFNAYVDGKAREVVDLKLPRAFAALNFDIHETLDRELIKKNGEVSTFYHSIIEVGERYGIDPHLLMTHSVMERWDRDIDESETDRMFAGASKGNFQLRVFTLNSAIKSIFRRFPDVNERNERFPILSGYSSFNEFKKNVSVKDYLDLDKTSEEEIELACIFLWDHYFSLNERFPGYFKDDFLIRSLARFPSYEEQNAYILWSIAYTSNINMYNEMSPYEVFVDISENMPGVYTWSRISPIIYQYIRKISEKYGYEGLQYDDFISINKEITQHYSSLSDEDKDFLIRVIALSVFMVALAIFMPSFRAWLIKTVDDFYDKYSPFSDYYNDEESLLEYKGAIKPLESNVSNGEEDLNTKKVKVILPVIFEQEAYKPTQDKEELLVYLQDIVEFVIIQVKKNPTLLEEYGKDSDAMNSGIYNKIIIEEDSLRNSYGDDFINDFRLFFPVDKYSEITLARLIAYLEENKSIVFVNRNTIETAA